MEKQSTNQQQKKIRPYLVYTKDSKSENTVTSGWFLIHLCSPNWSENKMNK
jgi:hypothetical protein